MQKRPFNSKARAELRPTSVDARPINTSWKPLQVQFPDLEALSSSAFNTYVGFLFSCFSSYRVSQHPPTASDFLGQPTSSSSGLITFRRDRLSPVVSVAAGRRRYMSSMIKNDLAMARGRRQIGLGFFWSREKQDVLTGKDVWVLHLNCFFRMSKREIDLFLIKLMRSRVPQFTINLWICHIYIALMLG